MKKIILDLCGGSGSWAKPYTDAGYEVYTITLPDNDVRNFHWSGERVYGIVAAPPCESFSNAGRGHIKNDYDLRSITPPEFAKAFFESNQ